MLKRSLMTIALCGMIASVAGAADYEFSATTGHPDGPEVLVPGLNQIDIWLNNNTVFPTSSAPLSIGGIVFDFSSPGGLLSWDLLGPDGESSPTVFPTAQQNADYGLGSGLGGIDDIPQNPNIDDDGFRFIGLLDGQIRTTDPGPGEFQAPVRPYFALHDPPSTGLELGAGDAIQIFPNSFPVERPTSTHVATLWVTAALPPGPAGDGAIPVSLVLGSTANLLVEGNNFGQITDLGGSEVQEFRLVPEPATMALLMLGGLTVLRRRRSA